MAKASIFVPYNTHRKPIGITLMSRLAYWINLIVFVAASAAFADDLETIIETCDGCHGENGISEWSEIPTIAGIDAFVHSDSLYVYRDKERPCKSSEFKRGDTDRAATDMCAVVERFSDEQIDSIAEYYAKLPFVPAKQEFDATLAAAGKVIHDKECSRCHSDGGSNPEDEAGILAGQWMCYLESTFAEYASGERAQMDKMKVKMDPLSEDDVNALLHYYASQQ